MKHPTDPKYRRFKPTNKKIKTVLVDPKGTLEYAVEVQVPSIMSKTRLMIFLIYLDGFPARGNMDLIELRNM